MNPKSSELRFLTVMALFCVLSASQVIASTNTLVGEWLNGSAAGTNFLDVSGYPLATNHGAFVVGAGKYMFVNDVPPAHTGQSLFLYNGDTGLAISNSSTLDAHYDDTFDNQINQSFTVECWAKGWPAVWNPFVSKYGEMAPSPSAGWQLRADAANHPCWTVRGAGGVVTFGTAVFGNPDDLAASSVTFGNDGFWHFYRANFDAGAGIRQLYIDGQLIASETNVTAYALAPLEHLCIGARDPDGSHFANFFTGEIYDVRIYNHSLGTLGCAIPLIRIVKNVDVGFGQTTQLTSIATADPAPNLGYGWTSNGVPVLNANTNVLTISNVTANAEYEFFITNQCEQTYSPMIFIVNVINPVATNLVSQWSNHLVLSWTTGTLQQASNPLGPWTPTGATSPYTNDFSTAPQMYYRLSYP